MRERRFNRRSSRSSLSEFLECSRETGGPQQFLSPTISPFIDGPQPKAAVLDRHAKECRDRQPHQSRKQVETASVWKMHLAKHQIDATRFQKFECGSHSAGQMTSESPPV
jgi:hypothetical protein